MTGLTQGDTILQLAPLEFARAGRYYYSSAVLYARGSNGSFWSGHSYYSTSTYSTRSYGLYFGSTYVGPQYGGDRGDGFSLRCLAC